MNNFTVWKIYCRSLQKKKLRHRVLIYPSESVFALGGNPFSSSVLSSIELYKQTKCSQRKGFILLVKDVKSAQKLAFFDVNIYKKIALELPENRPLTIISKAKARLPKKLCNQSKIAIRIVKDPFLQELIRVFPFPLISTSLNPPKKASTQSNIKARVFSKRMGINPFFIHNAFFTSKNTSKIYDATEDKWLR